jgi:dephospho-CoA kinase
MPPRLGVTGGIGSGKSTVIGMFARLGAAIIDTDAISRELTAAGGSAMAAIVAVFGPGAAGPDGALDRPRMRAAVFADPAARQQLEAILHPLILARCHALALAHADDAPLLIFDVPLLVEAKAVRLGLDLDRVLVVDCPPERQIAHAVARGGMDRAQVAAVIAAQAPRAGRLDLADDVIVNAGTREALAARVMRLWSRYCPELPEPSDVPSPGRPGSGAAP